MTSQWSHYNSSKCISSLSLFPCHLKEFSTTWGLECGPASFLRIIYIYICVYIIYIYICICILCVYIYVCKLYIYVNYIYIYVHIYVYYIIIYIYTILYIYYIIYILYYIYIYMHPWKKHIHAKLLNQGFPKHHTWMWR